MIRNNLSVKKHNCFFAFDNILGDSAWTRQLRRRVIQSSSHRFNACVSGPTGSGKRLVARSLHEHGPRRSEPFIPVDCARLPGNLFRSQVFGQIYRETTTLGSFRAANGGTLYLANIDRLSFELQLELLEVLETRSVSPVGTTTESHDVDVRIVVGARKNLDEEVREGRFRADLFSRLSVLSFETTTLASRPEDIEPIANHLLAKLTFERGLSVRSLSSEAIELLKVYDWPGNVRELRDVLDQSIFGSDQTVIDAEDLAIELSEHHLTWETLADLEAKHIRDTLAISCGNVEQAAALLGIDPSELRRKLLRLGD